MLHVYDNGEGDLVAANSPQQARDWYKKSGGLTDDEAGEVKDWSPLPDDKALTVDLDDAPAGVPHKVTQTCKEWAAGFTEPNMVASSNY